ncbi:MAG: hypothetical protein QT03_C0001G0179 [archaeon GW2011_AR10]|uniref:UPF0175 family protein n=1 Tax=Candidatus Iainarchaeum sp. TaxID=3101447 RepID=A0A7J4IXI4_9ARCH|nr:MAG: hypothetical protein QT03_C0001G0179 [archaeon GW2011_AR10]HIH08507.1 UPF0175 family protein [Candidatus Diapherotrites archaeon]
MQKILSMRIDEDDLEFVKLEAKEEKADKAKIIRELIEKGRLQVSIEQYSKGKISLGKAAEKAGITISEMMDKLAELGIQNPMTKEQYLQGLKNAEEML